MFHKTCMYRLFLPTPQAIRLGLLLVTLFSSQYGFAQKQPLPENAQTPRALRRVDAERRLRLWSMESGCRLSILRAPGIYAAERLPLERLHKRIPVLNEAEDVYTNHIHADDLAAACVAALFYGRPQRTYNICDGQDKKMGDYFDLVAQCFGLQKPPRVSRLEAEASIAEPGLSFMRESRRLQNRRMLKELRLRLKYPSVDLFLADAAGA